MQPRHHPDQLPRFRRGLLGVLLSLIGLEAVEDWRMTPPFVALILLVLVVLLPLPLPDVEGWQKTTRFLSLLLLVATLVMMVASLLPDNSDWLQQWGVIVGSTAVVGSLVRRFLLRVEWELAAGSVLSAIAETEAATTPSLLLEQVTTLLRDFVRADAAIALRQLDEVTAQALVCLPSTALPDQLSSPRLFAEALEKKRSLYYTDYPSTPKAAPVLLAKGTQSLAVLPLRKEQTTDVQGAILLIWYRRTPIPSHQRRFLDLLLGGLHTLLRLQHTTFRLEQLQVRYNAILKIPQGVVFVDASGGEGWLNQAAATVLGLNQGTVEPSAIALAMAKLRASADNKTEIEVRGAQLFSQPEAEIHDWNWVFTQPHPLVLSISSTPTRLGDVSGRLWLFDDITEKYFARLALAERTAQLEAVNEALRLTQFSVDRAADAIFWIGCDGRLLYVNHAACRLLGYSSEELLSMTIHEIDSNFTDKSWLDHWQILKHCGSLSLESHHRPKNGKPFPVEVRVSYLEFDGKEYNCAFVRDITERKRSEKALRWQREKTERLLLNILPQPIAERLKQETTLIADRFAEVTILFADIVGFTNLSARLPPTELVYLLNKIFSRFDQLTETYGLEKIKTIGDAYMVASGIPTPRTDHAEAMIEMALEMQATIKQFNQEESESFSLRIGINSGPVVAGVIGMKKFIYDLWGDAVNTASRMESHGIVGRSQVTETTYELCNDKFLFEKRGKIPIKGKGMMTTYLLVGRKGVKN